MTIKEITEKWGGCYLCTIAQCIPSECTHDCHKSKPPADIPAKEDELGKIFLQMNDKDKGMPWAMGKVKELINSLPPPEVGEDKECKCIAHDSRHHFCGYCCDLFKMGKKQREPSPETKPKVIEKLILGEYLLGGVRVTPVSLKIQEIIDVVNSLVAKEKGE